MRRLLSLLTVSQIALAQPQEIQVKSEIIKKYGLDTLGIHFEVLPENFPSAHLALYSPWNDSLKFNYHKIIKNAKEDNENLDSLISKVMEHEIIHYKINKFMKKIGLKPALEDQSSRDLFEFYINLLQLNRNENGRNLSRLNKFIKMNYEKITSILLYKMIDEGIGYSYEDIDEKPIIVTWPSSPYFILNDLDCTSFINENGGALMKSIIQRHGWDGVEYVLTHMPTTNDFSDLLGYQRRILSELSNKRLNFR